MRITVLCASPGIPLYGPSGASAHLRGIVRALADDGHDVDVAVSSEADHRGRYGAHLPVSVHLPPSRSRWRSRTLRDWSDARQLVAGLEPPDILWERQSLHSDAGVRAVRRWRAAGHDVRHLLEVNAPLSVERSRLEGLRTRWIDTWFDQRTQRATDLAACVSEHLTSSLQALGISAVHVPNGSALTGAGRREELRERLGLTGPVMGFVGSMKPWHGIDRIPDFLDLLPEWQAVVVGAGPTAPPAHPRLHALGHLEGQDLADAVAALDVGLAPYRMDAPRWFSPLKLFDYRAQGVPIVAAHLGDIPGILADGSGETVRDDDPTAWSHAIRRQLATPRVRRVRSWIDVTRDALAALTDAVG